MAITVSNTGYIKRTAITTYRNQHRGGKGRIGMRTRDEDFVGHLFVASTHAYIMIFSDRGRAYWLKVHEIPDVGPAARASRSPTSCRWRRARRSPPSWPSRSSTTAIRGNGYAPRRRQEDGAVVVQQPARRRHHRDGHRGRRRGRLRCRSPTATAKSSSARAMAWRSASRRATYARWDGRHTAYAGSRFEMTITWSRWKWSAREARC